MQEPSLTIVTAASAAFGRALWQFFLSADRHGIPSSARFLAYDIGLGAWKPRLAKAFPWVTFKDFDFSSQPPHVAVSRGAYAWKPLLIAEVLRDQGGLVLWLDSATLFKTADLSPVIQTILRDGTYTAKGKSRLVDHCHRATLEALGTDRLLYSKPERVAGVIGLNADHPTVQDLVKQWCHHALIENHIWPKGAQLAHHKPEQAILSILLYQAEAQGTLRLNDDEIDISSARPLTWMSSRNKVSERLPVWADPVARTWYRAYKTVDQSLLKWAHFEDTVLHGLDRWSHELFSVFVRRGERTVRLKAPGWSYYADPFLWREKGQTWLLVEQYEYRRDRGRLCAVTLDENLRIGPPIPILNLDLHGSFPYIFADSGQTYLVPETCEQRSVDLYVCEEFPGRWRAVRRLLWDVDAADSVLFRHDNLWWLLTSVREKGGGRSLAIFYSDDLMEGTFEPHPINQEGLYIDKPCSSGRNGGAVIRTDDGLVRVAQESQRYYGEGLQLYRIDVLDKSCYRESPLAPDHPLRKRFLPYSPHHLTLLDDLSVFDVRERHNLSGFFRSRN